MRKYIKLFEEHSTDIKADSDETSSTWSDVRDSIQMKLPFVIITFKDEDSYSRALKSEFFPNHIKQTSAMSSNGILSDYPSLFIVVDDDVSFKNKIPKIFDQFNVKNLILGKRGEDYCDVYFSDGTSSPAGNEIISSLSKDDMDNDDHFKMGSTYYKFIDFVDA
jgi:hypothetical protein